MSEVFTMLALVVPFFLILGGLAVKRLLYVGGPNEVLVFSGARPKAIRGGYHLRLPLLQVVDRLDLSNMAVEVSVQNAYSKGGIPLHVQGVANLKISGDQPTLGHAMQRFLGKSREEIITVAKETLEGNLRGVLSQLTPEEVNNDKLAFAGKLVEEAEQDLARLGLTLDILKIQNVSDEVGYLDSIGRRQSADLIMKARKAEAQADAEAMIQDAENRQAARLSELEAEIAIAEAETNKRVTDAETRREALIAEQVGQVKALVAKAEAELKVQQARIDQVRAQLDADVIAPAQARMEAQQSDAKGKAAKIIEDGKATMLVLEEMIATWQRGGDNARDIFLMQKLQVVMDSLVSTIQSVHVDKLTVLPGGNSRSANAVQLVEEFKAALGMDLPKIVEQFAGGGAARAVAPVQTAPRLAHVETVTETEPSLEPEPPPVLEASPQEQTWTPPTSESIARAQALRRIADQAAPTVRSRTVERPRTGATIDPPRASFHASENLKRALYRVDSEAHTGERSPDFDDFELIDT